MWDDKVPVKLNSQSFSFGPKACIEKAMATPSSTLAWKIPRMEPGRLQSMRSLRVKTQLSDFTFTFYFHALEKEMAAHSSILAWRIPGTEEPSGLMSMESHRVGHDWNDLAAAAEYLKSTITLKSLKIFLHYYLAFTVAVEMLTVNPHIVTLQVEFLLWPRSLSYIPNFGCF